MYTNENLIVKNQHHFNKVYEQARAEGLEKELDEALKKLVDPRGDGNSGYFGKPCKYHLHHDFAKMSFTFDIMIERKDTPGEWVSALFGGLIFHQSDRTWSIHT